MTGMQIVTSIHGHGPVTLSMSIALDNKQLELIEQSFSEPIPRTFRNAPPFSRPRHPPADSTLQNIKPLAAACQGEEITVVEFEPSPFYD